MESEVAREHHEDVLVVEPGHVVDDETHRDAVHAERVGRSDIEREGTDGTRRDDRLDGRDDAIVGEPTNRHSGFRELDRVVLHAEVDLACGATFPRHEAGVAEPDRHACGRTGRQRHEGRAIDDGAVKGQRARAVRERRQHDRGTRGHNDQGHDDQTGDEAEHVEATAGLIERLRRVGHEVMERSDRPGRYE